MAAEPKDVLSARRRNTEKMRKWRAQRKLQSASPRRRIVVRERTKPTAPQAPREPTTFDERMPLHRDPGLSPDHVKISACIERIFGDAPRVGHDQAAP